jgi:hypothetical protein
MAPGNLYILYCASRCGSARVAIIDSQSVIGV